jgi:hypothetical protein
MLRRRPLPAHCGAGSPNRKKPGGIVAFSCREG